MCCGAYPEDSEDTECRVALGRGGGVRREYAEDDDEEDEIVRLVRRTWVV